MISFIFLYHQLFQRPPDDFLTTKDKRKGMIILGFSGGILGIVLMYFAIEATADTLIDLRVIPLMLVTIHGGLLSTIITGAMITIYRFMLGINASSLASLFLISGSAVIFLYFAKKFKNNWKRIVVMLVLSNVVFSMVTYPLFTEFSTYVLFNVGYWFVIIVAGLMSTYMNGYLVHSNQLFKEYKIKAYVDPLTGLNNVRSFDRKFNEARLSIQKRQTTLSMLVVDIDLFKKVNDTYGHAEGDVILKNVALIIKDSTRLVDVVSRNGGEEFTVLMIGASHSLVMKIAEKIRENCESHLFSINNGEQNISITVSIGVATYPEHTQQIDDLYHNADAALYRAKNSGRNKVCS